MKTAEEWMNPDPQIEAGAPFICVTEHVIKQIQLDALSEGLRRYAWWKDGEQFVGTCGTTLKTALANVEKDIL